MVRPQILKQLVKQEDLDEICSLVEEDRTTINELINLLNDKDPEIRSKSIWALIEATLVIDSNYYFKEIEDMLIPRILKLLKDKKSEVRQEAAHAITNLPSREIYGVSKEGLELIEKGVPLLIELLDDKNEKVQRSAGTSLIVAGHWYFTTMKNPKPAIKILSKLATHKIKLTREDVACFFIKHSSDIPRVEGILPILNNLSKDSNETVRRYAGEALKIYAY